MVASRVRIQRRGAMRESGPVREYTHTPQTPRVMHGRDAPRGGQSASSSSGKLSCDFMMFIPPKSNRADSLRRKHGVCERHERRRTSKPARFQLMRSVARHSLVAASDLTKPGSRQQHDRIANGSAARAVSSRFTAAPTSCGVSGGPPNVVQHSLDGRTITSVSTRDEASPKRMETRWRRGSCSRFSPA